MTWAPPTVKTFIDSAMVTFFNSASTAPLEVWAAGYLGSSNPFGTPVSSQQVAKLGAAFGDTAYFNTLYGSLNNTDFLNAVSTNLTGAPLDAALQLSFTSILNNTRLQINPATGALYTLNEARGVTAAILAEGFLGAQSSDVAGTPYQTQWEASVNRTLISSEYAAASATSTFLVPLTVSPTDPGWVASQNILLGVLSQPSSVAIAEGQLAAAVAAGNTTPIIGQPPIGDTFTLTTAIGENLQGTIDDDTFLGQIGFGAGVDTLNAFDQLHGNGGIDTFNLVVGGVGPWTIPGTSVFDSVERIILDQSAGFAVDTGAAGIISANKFGGVTDIEQIGFAGAEVNNVGVGTTVGFQNTAFTTTVLFTGATGDISLTNVTDGSEAIIGGPSLTQLTVHGSVGPGAGIPGQIIVSTAAAPDDPTSITTLNLSLTSNAIVDFVPGAGVGNLLEHDTFTTVNGSTSTGGLTLNFTSSVTNNATNSALPNGTWVTSVSTGSGNDDVAIGIFDAAASVSSIVTNVGAGDDVVRVDGDFSTNNPGNVSLALTLGVGNDLVDMAFWSNIQVPSAGLFDDGIISITDFNGSTDTLDVSNFGTANYAVTNAEQGVISGQASLFAAVNLAAADGLAATAVDATVEFQYSGSTYVLYDADADGTLTSGDGLIQLTGFTGPLTAANFVHV